MNSNQVIHKYKQFLNADEIRYIVQKSKNIADLQHKAYSLAYKNYAKLYARQMKEIYKLYGKIPQQPPCPTLEYVPSNTKKELGMTVMREGARAMGASAIGAGASVAHLALRPVAVASSVIGGVARRLAPTKQEANRARNERARRRSNKKETI